MATATHSEVIVRSDLVGFAKECADLAMEAVEVGWTGKMSSKGHLIMRAPDGKTTMSISRSGGGRSLKNMRSNLERWKRTVQQDRFYQAVSEGFDQFEKDQFLERLSMALQVRTNEMLSDHMVDVMRSVYTIVLEREEVADFAFGLAKDERIKDFGWVSSFSDQDEEAVRVWTVNWAVFDRRDGRVIDLGGPRTDPAGEPWDREHVEVRVAEQMAFERKYPDGYTPDDEENDVTVQMDDRLTIVVDEAKPYECEVCHRRFKLPMNLGRHMGTHRTGLVLVPEPEDEETTVEVVESNPVGDEPEMTATQSAAVTAVLRIIDDLQTVGIRMAELEAERAGYDARLAEIAASYEARIITLTEERDAARESLAALKALVADL